MKEKNISGADAIRLASEVCRDQSNKSIKQKVLEMFGKTVSDSQVVNTLGSFQYRTRILNADICDAAKSLTQLCNHDKKLIFRAINKYCL